MGSTSPTDNFDVVKKQYPELFAYILMYYVLASCYVFGNEMSVIHQAVLWTLFGVWIFIVAICTTLIKKDLNITAKIMLLLFLLGVPVAITIYISYMEMASLVMLAIILFISVIWLVILGLIGDRKLDAWTAWWSLFSLLAMSSLYGQEIYMHVPTYLGGVKQSKVRIYMKNTLNNHHKISGLYLYGDNNFIYIEHKKTVFALNISNIKAIKYEPSDSAVAKIKDIT